MAGLMPGFGLRPGYRWRAGQGLRLLDRLSVQPLYLFSTRRYARVPWAWGVPLGTVRETGADGQRAFSALAGPPPVIDHAGIAEFIGAGAGRWAALHNQVGGNNALQTIAGAQPLYVAGSSPSFDGTARYMRVAHNADQLLTGGLTIAAWIRPAAWAQGEIVNKSTDNSVAGGFRVGTSATESQVNARCVGAPSVQSASAFTLGEWQHLIVTIDAAGAVLFYRNDIAAGGGAANAPSGIVATTDLIIGANGTAAASFYNGRQDDLFIFPGVITAADRALLVGTGAPT